MLQLCFFLHILRVLERKEKKDSKYQHNKKKSDLIVGYLLLSATGTLSHLKEEF